MNLNIGVAIKIGIGLSQGCRREKIMIGGHHMQYICLLKLDKYRKERSDSSLF
jgi:hypothetical protein